MSGSYYALNSKINNLQAEINGIQGKVGPIPPAGSIVTTNTAQTISAVKTFSTLPVSSVVPTTGNQLVNKTYVDNNVGPVPTLSSVLTSGNSATNSIALNNTGVGSNVISLLPNSSDSNPTITLTDGTTTNTIDKNGYTTRNTNANLTHYLNFSDSSSTGTGAILKTAGISVNPSINTVAATTFLGSLTGTATNATNAANAVIGTDNASTLVYPTFVKTSGAGNKALFIDDTTTPLTYNPSTGALTTTSFSGALTGTATNATNVAVTDDNTATTFYPTFVSDNTGNLPLKVDKTTGPLTYVPSTGVLTSTSFNTPGKIKISSAVTTSSTAIGFDTGTVNQGDICYSNRRNSRKDKSGV